VSDRPPEGAIDLRPAAVPAGDFVPPSPGERRFSEQALREYDGEQGRPAYIAFQGVVYDVTDAPNWRGGMHRNMHYPGLDLTRSFRKAPHDRSVFLRVPRVGVLADER
jgi:predicted heme/steroid binding protein